ncbi:MAG: ATP-binding cassette domain-containing protein [Myxococcales bacterium]|nr:ATP-binding cassette domain-containing protein [Myxococcota bacterium]MDW8283511.1 ATP-binding cassette domain-containing protein [Myxococcales bacterium]
MICLDDVWKSYDGRPALRGVTLHIDPGEAVLLTGPSGAGKSTLLRLVYMAEYADAGEVTVAGRSLGRLRRSSIPYVRRNIGVVFQDFRLMPERTALENVAVSAEVLALPRKEVLARARAALEAVGFDEDVNRPVRVLSGGLQQRVAIARALCGDPPILLGDEPTGNLDPSRAQEVLELLEAIRSRGTTLLVATHDPTVVAFGMAHGWRRAELQDGQIIAGGRPARELLAQSEANAGIAVGPLGEAETAPLRRDSASGRPALVTAERSLDLPIEVDTSAVEEIRGHP